MSTRGVIARQKGDTFEGRYHHWDSYPTGLGKALWDIYHAQFKGKLDEMLRFLIDEHPAGWSSVGKDLSRCFCHGDRHEEGWLVTEENATDSGCEYAYVFSPKGIMTILSSVNNDGSKMIGMFGMGNPDAKWAILACVDLNEPEPDWKSIQG